MSGMMDDLFSVLFGVVTLSVVLVVTVCVVAAAVVGGILSKGGCC